MTSPGSLLVASDFSEDADHALGRAALLCSAWPGSTCTLVHVMEPDWLDAFRRMMRSSAASPEGLESSVAATLAGRAETVGRRHGIAVDSLVRRGRIAESLAELAAGFDLLVAGARGTHPIRGFALGTTAERVLRRVSRPVLVVRRAPVERYRRVLVAVDGSDASRAALQWAESITDGDSFDAIHVYSSPYEAQMRFANVTDVVVQEYLGKARDDARAEMSRFLTESGLDAARCRMGIEYGRHVPSRVVERAAEMGADLVIAGRHGKSLTEQLLLGSVTLHLVSGCSCDVLVTQ